MQSAPGLPVSRNTLLCCVALLAVAGEAVNAQHLRLGVIGGTAVTGDYSTNYLPETRVVLDDGRVFVTPASSNGPGSRSPIGGPTLEWAFSERFSLVTNAIYRRLRRELGGPTVTWEFPIMAKYRRPLGKVAPFVEAGLAFRSTGNRNTEPSYSGVTAGAGLDWQWRGVRFAPTVRYTRWSRDRLFTHPSKQDQVEALFAVSRSAVSDRRPLGGRVRLGVTAGNMLIRPLRTSSSVFFIPTPELPDGVRTDTLRTHLRTWLLGPRIEVHVADRWGVAAEANYRQIRYREEWRFEPGAFDRGSTSFTNKSAVFWQFPVLVQRRFGNGRLQPFLEAGPTFRLPQNLGGQQATVGASGGAGVRFRLGAFNLQPGLRFTHWGAAKFLNGETAPNETRRNQLDAVVAFTF